VVVRGGSPALTDSDRRRILEALVPVRLTAGGEGGPTQVVVAGGLEADLHLDSGSDERPRRQLADLERQIGRLRDQLANPGFVERAPRPVVDRARAQLREAEQQGETLRRRLETSP
jgi:valyl-tRNA synthetase